MRYHLFLNFIRKMVKTTKVFSRKLAVKFQSSTTVTVMRLNLGISRKKGIFSVLTSGKPLALGQ